MDVRAWAADLPSRFWLWGTFNAQPLRLAEYAALIERVTAMTAPGTLEVLRAAVAHLAPGECYLEVGTWRGGTLIGALAQPGTLAHGYGVDSGALGVEHSPDGRGGREAWHANVAHAGLSERAHYLDGAVPALAVDVPPVGVYFFDGDKTSERAAAEGLAWAVPYLAPQALILVDDGNEWQVRLAVHGFVQQHQGRACVVLDIPTPGNNWPTFWNGIIGIYWECNA